MDWAAAIKAIGDSVSATWTGAANMWGRNDVGKAQAAAKKAGNAAKKAFKKAYPKCETDREYKRKIVPLIEQGLISDSRITDRKSYNHVRELTMQEVYNTAYQQIMDLYHESLVSQSGGALNTDTSVILQNELDNSLNATEKGKTGCLSLALVLLVSGSSVLVYFLSLI